MFNALAYYGTAIPVAWALIAFATAILYLAFIFGLFFTFLYIVGGIITQVFAPLFRFLNI